MESKELKEIVKKIRTFIARYPLQDPFDMMERKAFADNIAAEIKAYGDNRFNEALDKAAERTMEDKGHNPIAYPYITKPEILSLKIPTS